MNNFNTINLNLFQPIVYNKQTDLIKQDMENVYLSLLKKLDNSKTASEACINFKYLYEDQISFEIEDVGFADQPTQEVVEAVQKGISAPLPKHDMKIDSGKYKFIQLSFLPTKDNLFSTLMQISCSNNVKKSGNFFFRLLKESTLVILAQVVLPLEK